MFTDYTLMYQFTLSFDHAYVTGYFLFSKAESIYLIIDIFVLDCQKD